MDKIQIKLVQALVQILARWHSPSPIRRIQGKREHALRFLYQPFIRSVTDTNTITNTDTNTNTNKNIDTKTNMDLDTNRRKEAESMVPVNHPFIHPVTAFTN